MSSERSLIHGPKYIPGIENVPKTHFLSDVDGTLVPRGSLNLPPPRTVRAFHNAAEIGMPTGIITVRQPQLSDHLIRPLRLEGWSVFSNGGQIFDGREGVMIVERPISVPTVIGIARELQILQQEHVIQDNGVDYEWVQRDKADIINTRLSKNGLGLYRHSHNISQPSYRYVDDPSYIPQKPYIIYVDNVPAEKVASIQDMIGIYENVVSIIGRVNEDGTFNVYITHPLANKRDALLTVTTELGVHSDFPIKGFVSIGDGPPDKVLLESSEIGVAMGNAVQGTKDAAALIAPSIKDEGVAITIEELIL